LKALKTFLALMGIAMAVALHVAITGCTKEVDPAKYNAALWTNSINAPELTESEFVRLFAMRIAAELTGSKVRITGSREVTIKLAGGRELKGNKKGNKGHISTFDCAEKPLPAPTASRSRGQAQKA
jgi:hypothetical protein